MHTGGREDAETLVLYHPPASSVCYLKGMSRYLKGTESLPTKVSMKILKFLEGSRA